MKRTFNFGVLLALLLSGCAARKPDAWHHKPTQAPNFPSGALCGEPLEFENGETWLYPCFPQKAEPRCMKGCKP